MAEFVVDIQGPEAEEFADRLMAEMQAVEVDASIHTETEKSIDPVTSVMIALAAIPAAEILWRLWRSAPFKSSKITIRLPRGGSVELEGITLDELKMKLEDDD